MRIEATYKGVSSPKGEKGQEKMQFKAGGVYYSFRGYESGHDKGDMALIETTGYNITSVNWA